MKILLLMRSAYCSMTRPTPIPSPSGSASSCCGVVWGSTYLGMKIAMDGNPAVRHGRRPRFIPAGILLPRSLASSAEPKAACPDRTGRQVLDASIVGVLPLARWDRASSHVGRSDGCATGIAALLIALVPMTLAIFGLAPVPRVGARSFALGIGVGLVGVAILAWPDRRVGGLDPGGLAALLVSPIAWTLGAFYAARRAVLPAPALLASSVEMFAAGLAMLVLATLTGEWAVFDVNAVSTASWLGITYLVVMGSLVGYTTFAWLIQVAPLSRVSTYAYVNPVVAVILGSLVLRSR